MGEGPITRSRRKRLRPYHRDRRRRSPWAPVRPSAPRRPARTSSAGRAFAGYHDPGDRVREPATATPTDGDADQAPRRDLRRERVVRPLLRHLPVRGEHGRHHVPRQAGHADGERPVQQDHQERPGRPAADGQPERVQPAAADSVRGPDLRPEPRLHAGAGGRRQREDGQVRPGHRASTPAAGGVEYCPPGIVMDYYDGNTVTGLWNYAQYYSMSDNNWDPTFGPSSPGAVNVTSG